MKPEEFLIQLKKRPLFEAIHLIEQALLRSQAQLGSDELPKKEKLGLKVNASLGYENAQLVNATLSEHKVFLETNLLGLTGEQGVLPSYYSELAIGREKAGDGAMVDFYNIFNHRLLSLYYRSWQLSQFAVQAREHNKGNRAPLLSSLEAVTGHEKHLNNYYGGLFAQKGRGKGALKDLIEHLTDCEAKLHELQGQWMSVSQDEQTKLAGGSSPEGQYAQLGRGASIGAKAWNINAGITIELFPTNTLQVEQLLPNKSSLVTIKSVVQDYVGKHKRINWKLTTRHKHLPQVRLVKGSGQLGIGTVLAKHKRTKDRKITITI